MQNNELYNPFEAMSFNENKCFLCGCEFSEKNPKTEEHVFPKWLQRECNLWNENIDLLNKTGLKYKDLKIPCCSECNTIHLQELETEISEKAKLGYDDFINLDEKKIFQWIAKIYYGIFFKEVFLKYDRKNKNSENILTPNDMYRFKMLHSFLQSVRIPFVFDLYVPWSIFLFKTIKYNDERCFFYTDSPNGFCSIRFNNIGIIVVFEDNGIHKTFFYDKFLDFHQISLANIQFDEISAIIHYKHSIFNRTPKYLIQRQNNLYKVTSLPIGGLSNLSPWNDWDKDDFKKVLAKYWAKYGLTEEQIITTPNNHTTFIKDETGMFLKQFNSDNKIEKMVKIL